jgi:hypothetical protein
MEQKLLATPDGSDDHFQWFVGFLMDHLFFWRQGTSLDTPLNFGVYLIT